MSIPGAYPGCGLVAASADTRSRVGAMMGRRTSARKRKAVRVNGRLGGPPVKLGVLGLRYNDESPRILVCWSRSYSGIVFTQPSGVREFWGEGGCASPEDALVLMDAWFAAHPKLIWFPFWGPEKRWKLKGRA